MPVLLACAGEGRRERPLALQGQQGDPYTLAGRDSHRKTPWRRFQRLLLGGAAGIRQAERPGTHPP